MNRADQDAIHRFSFRNRDLLETSERAGCFYCQELFDASEIQEWVDEDPAESAKGIRGVTAVCPRCGIDAVIPSSVPLPLSKELLAEMHAHWF